MDNNINRLRNMAKGYGNDFEKEQVCEIKTDHANIVRVFDDINMTIFCGMVFLPCKSKEGRDTFFPFKVSRKYLNGAEDVVEMNILGELMDFMDTRENKLVDGKIKKVPKYKTIYPNVFNFMFPEDPSAKKWKPTQAIFLNVIDYSDDWCASHQHTKLLSKSAKSNTIGGEAFTALTKVVEINGDCRQYDVCFSKSGRNMDTEYGCAGIMNPKMYPQIYNDQNKRLPMSPMTEEEKQYDVYDTVRLTTLTPARIILDKIGEQIAWIDGEIGGNYYNRLMEQASKENAEKEKVSEQTPHVFVPAQTSKPIQQSNPIPVQQTFSKPNMPNVVPPTGTTSRFQVKKPPVQQPQVEQPVQEVEKDFCPACQELIPINSASCPYCYAEFEPKF